jgi:hypothetical protein
MDEQQPKPPCNWPIDERGMVPFDLVARDAGTCTWPPDARGFILSAQTVDKHGHRLDGDWDTKGKNGCDHRDTPEWRAEHRHKERHIMSEPVQAPVVVPPALDPNPPATTATVGVPQMPSASDLAGIASGAGGGLTGVAVAAIAVLGGGGAVWKFLQNRTKLDAERSEQAHQQRMKELELQADNQKRDDEKHQQCNASRVALEAKLAAAEQRLAGAEQSLSAMVSRLAEAEAKVARASEESSKLSAKLGDDDSEEKLAAFSKRITKLENALKKKG